MYLSEKSDYGRDYRASWNYPITINTEIYYDALGESYNDNGAKLLYFSIIKIDKTNKTINSHLFGYNASTPCNRYGFVIKGY